MKKLTEEDIKNRYITPAIERAGWAKEQVFMEHFFTNGQVIVRGNKVTRGKQKKADYLLTRKEGHRPLAIVEAKDADHSVGDGIQQAMEYAGILNIPFAYSSNGCGFIEHDYFTGAETELSLDEFPSENELWERYLTGKNIDQKQERIIEEPDHFDSLSRKKPRYYQRIAIDKTIEAIAKGQRRVLLVMATGTGKTFTAFQIIWKLLKTKTVKRVLYLADRNILIDQTMQQDFRPFEKIMTKIQDRKLDSSYEVYMSLYHQLSGDDGYEPFREFQPGFFDLIIVDECHRGSAREESQWRRILDYFNSAIHIGMTATPKETKEISNITYFGDPVYTYSLKQGIDDGFLAPYKVIRIGLDKDLEGWRPYKGQLDVNGNEIEDREYNIKDFDHNLIIDERTKAVANRITKWLSANGRFSKTIVFCVDIEHAERTRRALINENKDLVVENPKYIMRITGDNPEGKAQLDYFIDVNEKYPALVTTSKLMTTGVDVKTCKLIVLDSNINSMTEFKQIIGRGTRLYPEYGKEYFTIMDFRNVCRLFADPDFDGDPVVVIDAGDGGDKWNPKEDETAPLIFDDRETEDDQETLESLSRVGTSLGDKPHTKIRVNGVIVTIINERVQYCDINGKLITESIKDYSKRNILDEFATLDEFLNAWTNTEQKKAIIEELESRGVLLDALKEESGKDLDDFDLILHIAYDKKPLTKRERVEHVRKKGYLYKYSGLCREVLSALLEKYMDQGISELEDTRILDNAPFDRIGSPKRIASLFGGKDAYLRAVKELERAIYEAA
ncbi:MULTISPECIES: EcoAI/FtnUII family type I restriction enzme subunit R [Synergistaceae]|uniref:EcoAI/FtnUII family type I restriction enzme subunit R n=1 Tax=Synergistaceae TaxID=649777 RepID=UPI003ADF06D4|nr:DEAD/DEAH box helicase family protein [Synergistaceae bacterium DZ-S4]